MKLLLFSAVLAAAGCGGGGGGGGNGGAPPPTSPSGDDTFGTLALNEDTVDAIAFGMSLTEGALGFSQMAINATLQFGGAAGAPETICHNSTGTLSVDHRDNDASFTVSAGDELHITWDNCFNEIVGIGDGTVSVAVTDFSIGASSASLAGVLTTSSFVTTDRNNPELAVSVSADLEFDFHLQSPQVLSIRASGSQFFQVAAGDLAETLSDFLISKTATDLSPDELEVDIQTQIELSFVYDSGLLGGSFTCESSELVFRNRGSVAAEILCTGLNRSALRVTNADQVELDPDGNGTFAAFGTLQWVQIFDGFLVSDSGILLADLAGDIPLRRITMHTRNLAYDPLRDRVLITTAVTDIANPGALVELSVASNTVRRLVSFASEPNLVRLSEDGTAIYVSFTEGGEVRRYDAANMQQVASIQVESDRSSSGEYAITDLAVSPTESDVLAVALQLLPITTTDIVIVDGESQRADSFLDAAPGEHITPDTRIDFSTDGGRLFATQFGSNIIHVANVTDLGMASPAVWNHGLFGRPLKRHGDRLYSGIHVFDGVSLVKVGQYSSASGDPGVDILNNLVFSVDATADALSVFQRDTFVPLARYELNLNEDASILDIVPAGASSLLVSSDSLYIVDVAGLQFENAGECEIVPLATSENELYTQYACPVRDAVYDVARNRIYAAIESSLGSNGNSIAVIDHLTGLVQQYVFVGSEPKQLALSGDGALLYVVFDGSDSIVAVDLDSLSISRNIQIQLRATVLNQIEAPHVMQMGASPVENDTVIVSLSMESFFPGAFAALRNGIKLPDEVGFDEISGLHLFPEPQPVFDGSGAAYAIGLNGSLLVQSLLLGPGGLSIGPSFDADPVSLGVAAVDVAQNEVFTATGGVINLTDQSAEERYDERVSGTGGRGVNADAVSGDVFILMASTTELAPTIGRFDYLGGALEAQQQFEFLALGNGPIQLFDVGTDQLGMVDPPFSGLVVVDKSSIQ